MVRICFITCWYKGISVANYSHGLIENLERYPFVDIKIVSSHCRCLDKFACSKAIFETSNCEFVNFPPYFNASPKSGLGWLMTGVTQALSNIFRGMRFLSKSKSYDIIHYHNSISSFGIFPLLPILMIPTNNKKIISVHSLNTELFSWLSQWLWRRAYKKADALLVYSEEIKSQLIAFGVAAHRVIIVPHGVIIPPLLSSTRNEIAFFGAPNERKGAFVLLEAIKILKERGENTKVHFYGICSDSEKDSFLTQAKKLNVTNRLVWGGRLSEDEFTAKMQASMVTFAVYQVPISGSSIFTRAMANGTPVIATNIVSMPAYFQGAIISIPPNNPQALAEAILKIENDPSLVEKLSKIAREEVYKVSWSSVARNILGVYIDVLKNKKEVNK
jgi:glycosyltransferase involved in cell wall biosynthesis